MSDEKTTKVLEYLKKKTREFAEKNGYLKEEKESKLSRRAQKIKKVIEAGAFECRTDAVAELFSILLDEKISMREDAGGKVKFVKMCVVVPSGSDNGHNYEKNEPCMPVRGNDCDICITKKGTCRNHITMSERLIRPATEKEIEAFVKAVGVDKFELEAVGFPE